MILNGEQLREEAHKSALNQDPYIKRKSSRLLWGLGQSDIEDLRSFVSVLREKRSSCAQPAEEWLLDNAEFLEEQALVIKQELTKKVVNSLPHLTKTKEARVYTICKNFIKFTDGKLNMDHFISYLRAYQEISVLTMSEVWSIPMFLRVALIHHLAEVMNTLKERHETCTFVDDLLSNLEINEITPEKLNLLLEDSGQEFPLSGPMIVHLVTHLRERADYTATVGEWLVCKLENGPESLDHILSYEYQLQASFGITTGNLITSLRKLNRWNWHETFEQISIVEQTLRKEATGTYAKLDFSSRNMLRKRIEHLSRRFKLPENLVATEAIGLVEVFVKNWEGNHPQPLPRQAYVAYYLLEPDGMDALRNALKKCGKPRPVLETGMMRRPSATYFNMLGSTFTVFLLAFTLFISWDLAFSPLQWLAIILVLVFPAIEWAITGVHWFIEKIKQPMLLLRYDFSKEIPAEAATAVVIPVIWSSVKDVEELTDRLELHYLANKHQHLHFALLGDFADAATEHHSQDDMILKAAKKKIKQLNQTYPNGSFVLLQRQRKWNQSEGIWMGWERKRGKLVEFVELLKGKKETSFTIVEGNLKALKTVRYIITLDSDTELPLESAHRMIGTLHYPYNQPRLNDKGTRVIEGYGVLQPRVAISHDATTKSNLAHLWSSDPGIDPYAFAVSDAYQDNFGQGIFTGKGIFDLNAFYEVLCDRIPENRVLSHDLLEGGFLRAGLLSDIELIDDHPAVFSSYQKRLHRWVRGDWQLLLWLLPKARNRNGELTPVDLSVLTRWQIIDNLRRSLLSPSLYFMMLLALTVLPGSAFKWILIAAATLFIPVFRSLLSVRTFFQNMKGFLYTLGQVLVLFITLPFQTVLLLDAIVRTVYRLTISKKRLLQWTTSAEEERNHSQKRNHIYGLYGGYLLIGLFAVAALLYENTTVRVIGLLLAALWACTPLLVRWLNKPVRQESLTFSKEESEELRKLSREIWSFYEDYVTEEDSWLPPDNVQIDPPNGVAHRTSPTNIGLYLTCTLAARDFSFIDTTGLIQRLERTLDTIDRLDKWEGHLYNWYDTVTLKPLSPIYVSTVDSGNFVGCLITVKEGLIELLGSNETNHQDHHNQSDSLNIAFSEELTPISSGKLLRHPISEEWLEKGKELIKRIDKMIYTTNFVPLYDHNAKLFTLGYHVERNERDDILYDLMASEARTASFISIALGQISVSHWKALGRTMTKAGKRPVLLSWSATMFEYLMPWLFMRTYRNSLWESTYKAVVDRQIEYGEQRGVPYGISESGFYAFDYQMNYQYRAFGVPGLGFKRGLEQDLVIAPYATILSLPFAKDHALQALKDIEKLNGRGKYGYYEAIDFTKRRLPENKKHMVIRSFMAHHQGMSFLTLANLLLPTPIYERFHRNKQVRAAELLLQERVPKKARFIKHPAMSPGLETDAKNKQDIRSVREYRSPHTKTPEVNVLSNGDYTTVVTNSGSGFSLYKGLLISRWRPDPVMDPWGSYVYVRDISTDQIWSPSYHPCKVKSSDELVVFGLDKATFMRKDGEIKTRMEISVSPEFNAEVRRITLSNSSKKAKVIEVTTFTELALANPIADEAHTTFSKLFIRTEFDQDTGCLVAGRRPREKDDQTLWATHALLLEDNQVGTIEYDTSRSSFIGRGYRLSEPREIRSRLRGKIGSVADPAFIMRRRISIKPGGQVQLFAITSVGESREEAIDIIRRFSPDQSAERTFQMAWNRAQIELRNLRLKSKEAIEFQTLAGQILYRSPLRKESVNSIVNNQKGQSSLWSYGISGDRPILLVRIENESQMPFVVKVLTGHEYLRRLGLLFDLVLLNESAGGYQQNLQESLQRAAEHGVDRFGAGSSGVFAIPANQLPEEDKNLLMAVARLILKAGSVSLTAQMRIPKEEDDSTRREKLVSIPPPVSQSPSSDQYRLEDTRDWQFFNSWGGFSPDGKEYHILIKNGHHLPAPWINVIANPKFGTFISELGTGYTWWNNSREFKLTPWSNDPVLDPPTETAFLRDEESGEIWSVTPSAVQSKEPYKVTHGRGYSRFEHERNNIFHEMMVYVPKDDPIKIMKVKLKNNSNRKRQISLTYYAEWVLGVMRPANAPYIVSEWNDEAHILTAKNTYQGIFREAVAFLGIFPEEKDPSLLENQSWTTDRTEFIGRNGSLEQPAALEQVSLSCHTGVFNESCGAIQQKLALDPDSEQIIYIVLGCDDSHDAVIELVQKYRQSSACERAFDEISAFWDHHLNQIQVSTPSAETDILLNGWLLYQSLACRMWARTAFYQAGGAYGFRDQLQDSLAMLHTLPQLTRKQILLHASHQYEEGDVQHWWHEETQRGIRTLFSDDLLWLPYTVSRYIEHTGDSSILDEVVPFLHSEPLKEGEHERYEPTVQSSQSANIYEHCLRAIDKALSRIGEHGLPLMGVGDWNDGMNLVGANGRGESVWLGWFICDILKRFKGICHNRGDAEKAKSYLERKEQLITKLNKHAWDGQWYRRAFTDSGDWLGSIGNEECQIDAIAQSWSVISGGAPKERAEQAMNSFDRELVDRDLSVVRLLTPAFDKTEPSPGYIQGYPPGLRENGAQYTHGVIWGIVAWCQLGNGNKAMEMFNMLNPMNHTRTDQEVKRYVGEPYAMAADVYTARPNEGHAGWTWYTGAASWMYQAGIEWILGIRRLGNKLVIDPKIPHEWHGFSVSYRYENTLYLIKVRNHSQSPGLTIDGRKIDSADDDPHESDFSFQLVNDGKEHTVEVRL